MWTLSDCSPLSPPTPASPPPPLPSPCAAAPPQVWIQPGSGLAEDYLKAVETFTNNNTEVTIVALLGIFALFHSGLAALRPKGEELIGARAYRVMFALISLPLATVPIFYFINHRCGRQPVWPHHTRGQCHNVE